jgi:hypothetical protein
MRLDSEKATAYHEAGHAVMAFHLGVASTRKEISIVRDDNSAGRFHHRKLLRGRSPEQDDSSAGRIRMEKEILISLAGPVAQHFFNPRSVRHYHGKSDHQTAVEIAVHLNGGGEEATAYLKWLGLRTKRIVKMRWPLVKALAKEALARKTMTGKEVNEFLSNLSFDGRRLPPFQPSEIMKAATKVWRSLDTRRQKWPIFSPTYRPVFSPPLTSVGYHAKAVQEQLIEKRYDEGIEPNGPPRQFNVNASQKDAK